MEIGWDARLGKKGIWEKRGKRGGKGRKTAKDKILRKET